MSLFARRDLPRLIESNGEHSELSYYKFNVMSTEEIERYSVAEIKETKTLFGEGCVYDERMGMCENSNTKACLTCRQPFITCPGHFGHIKLAHPIIHPMLCEDLLTFLRVVCFDCHQPILSADHLRLLRRHRKKGNYKIIAQLAKKFPICVHCMHNQPTYSLNEGKIYYFYKDKENQIELSTLEIDATLSALKASDLVTLGIAKDVHPCHIIMKALPVCPPCTRPYVSMDGHIYDDDITMKYIEIIKANRAIEREKVESKRKLLVGVLEFHVSTLFDNSKGKARQINGRPLKGVRERINGKGGRIRNNLMGKRTDFCGRTVIGADPSLALNEVGFPEEFATNLTIPENVNRLNYHYLNNLIMCGKANYVIRGDKTFNLKYGVGQKRYERAPLDMIMMARYGAAEPGKPAPVQWYWEFVDNVEVMRRKPFKIKPTDRIWKESGEIVEGFTEETVKHFDLKLGDVVERQLRDGDRVILNRQPTLHKGSMLCPKIKILKGKTLRLPISICSAYNADFDGDEMNIFVPQSHETISEAENIVATEANMSTSQFPRPIVNICQDNLTAGYMMTRGLAPGESVSIARYLFFDALMKLKFDMFELDQRMEHIKYALRFIGEAASEEEAERKLFTGYGLISMLLPSTLTVTIKNNIRTYEGDVKEQVEIRKGVLLRGTLDKTALGNKSGSLVHVLMKDFGNEVACDFVTHFQYITDHWFLHDGVQREHHRLSRPGEHGRTKDAPAGRTEAGTGIRRRRQGQGGARQDVHGGPRHHAHRVQPGDEGDEDQYGAEQRPRHRLPHRQGEPGSG
jgi:DNA-directed RNA polymerase beta' subunit